MLSIDNVIGKIISIFWVFEDGVISFDEVIFLSIVGYNFDFVKVDLV